MKVKKWMTIWMAGAMAASLLAGCGSTGQPDSQKTDSAKASDAESTESESTESESVEEELPDLEVWYTNLGTNGVAKDGPWYNFYKEVLGVGITEPYVEWNGGQTYQEQLNLRISAGKMPDMFLPVNGMEADLIKNGGLLDLTDLLPEMAPHLWETIPQEVWDVIRTYDPSGEGRIYVVPTVVNFARQGAMIRQDWLDKLELQMPTTQEEFVDVLKAFKTRDPNGNGIQDEIPTGGRAEARWMDHLFAMYGIAMFEGYPDWDIYDGEFTYSAVTPNMKDALQFMSELYAEGLMDPETLLNDKAGWEGKIDSNQVGVFFHWINTSYAHVNTMKQGTGIVGDWAYLPAISAPGYEGFYTQKQLGSLWMACSNTEDESKIKAMMKVLDGVANPDNWEALTYGPEGYTWNYDESGNKVMIVDDTREWEPRIFEPLYTFATKESAAMSLDMSIVVETDSDIVTALERSKDNLNASEGKAIAGDGMPTSIYEGYPDILNRTLYAEYASKIIAGEYPIDKFDEFVEKWYATGGEEVTKRAREWYEGMQK